MSHGDSVGGRGAVGRGRGAGQYIEGVEGEGFLERGAGVPNVIPRTEVCAVGMRCSTPLRAAVSTVEKLWQLLDIWMQRSPCTVVQYTLEATNAKFHRLPQVAHDQ